MGRRVMAVEGKGKEMGLHGSGVVSEGVGSIGFGPRGARDDSSWAARSRRTTGVRDGASRTRRQGALIIALDRGLIF